eukprot:CAMPEP_0172509710 /NCGR_PEP_ID=MMETSP1066-20121228/222328_1 /TAXON_ID=671091 /ORGANISM="Coscinodiscus wailesii, Strain CCMP2513" /LENGTH=141 /DNA_ID=CAMNT_0013288323 /DNA_START=194 /DNA_END=619 /DNA_ORIENTATION=+
MNQPIGDMIDPSQIPEGFSAVDPSAPAGAASQQSQMPQKAEAEARKQAILEQALTIEALERLRRIKLVKPERAVKIESSIVSMAMQGRLPGKINEGRLIEMLEGLIGGERQREPEAGKISIQRKKYAFDSDEDDDDDEDLM